MTGTIQGYDAVLSLFKEEFVPFVCGTDVSITMESDELPIRTMKGGHWKNFTYNNASYSISLSGLLKFDSDNWTGWDMIDNWLNFASVLFLISFDDGNGNVRSMQGEAMIKSNALSWSAGALVKNDFNLTGKGELKVFDGLIPCDTVISTITVTGQTAGDGIIHIAYTYTGSPYQIKYRIDGTGNYIYALIDQAIAVPGLANGSHDVEVIPVCQNDYEGTGADTAFVVTSGLTCSTVITDITITSTSATPVFTGTAPIYFAIIDGGTPVQYSLYPSLQAVSLSGLSAGAHTIQIIPECANGVTGTSFTKSFTVAVQPAQSVISWVLSSFVTGNTIQIFVNGIMSLSTSTSGSGSIIAPTGSSVKGVLLANNNTGSNGTLRTTDTTDSSILDTRNGTAPTTLQFTFTPNGDAYSIHATVTP